MKQSILIIIVIHVFMFSNISLAQTVVTPQTEMKEYALDKKDSEEQNKQELYKLLYENSVHANDQMTTTMRWAIGLVVTFIIILLGSQVFFNYRINKEEINTIRSELDEMFSILKSDIFEKVNKTSKENEESTRHSFQKLGTEIQNNMNSRFKEIDKLFEVKIESFGNGVCQDSCRVNHQAAFVVTVPEVVFFSFGGFSQTSTGRSQLRISPDHRSGCLALAAS